MNGATRTCSHPIHPRAPAEKLLRCISPSRNTPTGKTLLLRKNEDPTLLEPPRKTFIGNTDLTPGFSRGRLLEPPGLLGLGRGEHGGRLLCGIAGWLRSSSYQEPIFES